MKGFLSRSLACAIWLTVVAMTVASVSPAAASLPVPGEKKIYLVGLKDVPVVNNDPAAIIPIGIGPYANGSGSLTIKIGLPPFTAPVDLYFVIYIPVADEAYIYYTGEASEPFTMDPTPWKTNVKDSVAETLTYLSNLAVNDIPEGMYYLGLVATPAGSNHHDPNAYDIWITQFAVGRTISLANNCTGDIWAAASGNNLGAGCKSDGDCNAGGACSCNGSACPPNGGQCTVYPCRNNGDCNSTNSYCGGVPAITDKTCTKDADCGGLQYCDKLTKKCGYMNCLYVPIPVEDHQVVGSPANCKTNKDCCPNGGDCSLFCYTTTSATGSCATLPQAAVGNSWLLHAGATQNFAVPTPWAGRFWPRTGCAEVATGLLQYAGSDAQCPSGSKIDTSVFHQYALKCRADSDCTSYGTDLGGKCITTGRIANFESDAKACTTNADCESDARYTGKKYGCYKAGYGPNDPGKCGYYNCTSYQCMGHVFTCDTGGCFDEQRQAQLTRNCRQSGTNSPTLAELNMDFPRNKVDYYDISLVDGANVPVQIGPVANTYTMTPASKDAIRTDVACTKDSDCWTGTVKLDANWICDTTKKYCVNKFYCGSPGCVSDCKNYGTKLTDPSTWGGRNLAVPETGINGCKEELKLKDKKGNYIGCLSPTDACSDAHKADPWRTALTCDTRHKDLFQCIGANAQSCYTAGADKTKCCGCPDWMPAPFCDVNKNSNATWRAQALPYYQAFHKASPNSYTYPYDDKSGTFTCMGRSATANVNYTITFCPK